VRLRVIRCVWFLVTLLVVSLINLHSLRRVRVGADAIVVYVVVVIVVVVVVVVVVVCCC